VFPPRHGTSTLKGTLFIVLLARSRISPFLPLPSLRYATSLSFSRSWGRTIRDVFLLIGLFLFNLYTPPPSVVGCWTILSTGHVPALQGSLSLYAYPPVVFFCVVGIYRDHLFRLGPTKIKPPFPSTFSPFRGRRPYFRYDLPFLFPNLLPFSHTAFL